MPRPRRAKYAAQGALSAEKLVTSAKKGEEAVLAAGDTPVEGVSGVAQGATGEGSGTGDAAPVADGGDVLLATPVGEGATGTEDGGDEVSGDEDDEEEDDDDDDEPTPAKKGKKTPTKRKRKASGKKKSDEPKAKKIRAKKTDSEKAAAKTKLRKEASLTKDMDLTHECHTMDGRQPNMKISSWNVNGIRAWLDKGGLSYISDENPDIFCVQETKCALADIPTDVKVDGYHDYWFSAKQPGYSGVGLYSKVKPENITNGIGVRKHDKEGRTITAEYEKFYLVTTYVPNAGRGLPRLPYRYREWDPDFKNFVNALNKKKPVIICGDMNVAHKDIDIANPKTNKKSAGFSPEEKKGFTELLADGYIDTYRELYPSTVGAFTYWSNIGGARAKNVGWRLDYFLVSEKFKEDVCDNVIRKDIMGSDHCPIVLYMAMK